MKDKIKNALKTEYAKLGLGDKAFDGVASFLAKTITKEEDIDGVIKQEDTANLLKAFQGETDSLRNKHAQAVKDLEDYKKSHPDTDPTKKKEVEDEPEWAKQLRQQNAEILAKEAKREKAENDARVLASIKESLEKAGCTNKGILNLTLRGFALNEGETEADAVKRLTDEYNANVTDAFGEGVIPPAGGGAPKQPDKKEVTARRLAYLEKQGLLPKEEENKS